MCLDPHLNLRWGWRLETGASPPVKYFTDRSKAVLLLWIFYVFSVLCLLCLCVCLFYMCFVVTCWERADLLALVCGVLLWVCHFPIGILGQMWLFIVSIPDLCTLTFTYATKHDGMLFTLLKHMGPRTFWSHLVSFTSSVWHNQISMYTASEWCHCAHLQWWVVEHQKKWIKRIIVK